VGVGVGVGAGVGAGATTGTGAASSDADGSSGAGAGPTGGNRLVALALKRRCPQILSDQASFDNDLVQLCIAARQRR
jgi:hypothetical protein